MRVSSWWEGVRRERERERVDWDRVPNQKKGWSFFGGVVVCLFWARRFLHQPLHPSHLHTQAGRHARTPAHRRMPLSLSLHPPTLHALTLAHARSKTALLWHSHWARGRGADTPAALAAPAPASAYSARGRAAPPVSTTDRHPSSSARARRRQSQ